MAISKKDAKASGRKAQDVVSSVADGKLSRAKRKKLAKLRRKALHRSWCWYCDREFEDDKVLLSHQKAKHFRCPHCPRRLNTAGGLAVHIDQVHKLGTDRIANALPGRDSFDVEIYGMVGIPANDLREWKRKKAVEAGMDPTAEAAKEANKPKISKVVISLDELRRQLGVHKDLMEGKITPSQAAQLMSGANPTPQPFSTPIPPMPAPMSMPGMMPPPGMPAPPPGMPMPPPGMPLPPTGMPLPPGVAAPPSGSPMPPANMPPPPGGLLPPQAAVPGQVGALVQATVSAAPVPYELKAGQVLVTGNPDTSPEERRALQERYAVKGDAAGGRPRAADLI